MKQTYPFKATHESWLMFAPIWFADPDIVLAKHGLNWLLSIALGICRCYSFIASLCGIKLKFVFRLRELPEPKTLWIPGE